VQIDETTYDNVVSLELTGLGLDAFGTESLAVDECAIRALDVFDVNLGRRRVRKSRPRGKREKKEGKKREKG
jgi:hypothetical protein